MEELDDFDIIVHQYQQIKNVFWAVFDPNTGVVMGIYPNSSADEFSNKVKINDDVVEAINRGEIQLKQCFVNVDQTEVQISDSNSLIKIDDILHRIIEKKWSEDEDFDVLVQYDKEHQTLKLSLAEYLGGTAISNTKKIKRQLDWAGDTKITLIISDYNDPNVLYYFISLRIDDLIGKEKIIENLKLPEYFSVYTRRIFKNYILDIL